MCIRWGIFILSAGPPVENPAFLLFSKRTPAQLSQCSTAAVPWLRRWPESSSIRNAQSFSNSQSYFSTTIQWRTQSPTISSCFRVQEFHSFHGRRDDEMGRSSKPMDFVRGIIVEDGKRFMGSSHFPGYSVEQIADCLLKADVQ
ncbi:hypothetical protein CUMW_176130 [Citrus unshiu]|uniref:Uncharacterized protein n=1 Tax=Citrus unshiu TaxID=55188 RepID=A0A2H5PXD1_CITUN|nr:hypothetical protein CUMW_176130 [Citrus unshiu]